MRNYVAAALAAGMLAGCTSPEPLANTVWQISDVYTTTEYPSQVPDSLAGLMRLSLGDGSFTGFTGCSHIIGTVTYTTAAGKDTTIDEAATMTPTGVEVQPIEEGKCIGRDRFLHEGVVAVLSAGPLQVERRAAGELVLRAVGDNGPGADQPALRLVRSVGSSS